MRIDGLGIRGTDEAEALAAQSEDDYYVGAADPTGGNVTQVQVSPAISDGLTPHTHN